MGGGERVGKRQGLKRIRPKLSWIKKNRSKYIFLILTPIFSG
jgi:hypothetical protein